MKHNYWSGKHRSDSTKNKISVALKKIYDSPEKHPQFIGKIKRSGYWYIKIKGHPSGSKQGYVAEHRLILEKHLGRYLTKKEVVHHIDHDTLNNSIDNLCLCKSAGQHTSRFHPEVFGKCGVANKGIRRSPITEFKKGFIPWNKKK